MNSNNIQIQYPNGLVVIYPKTKNKTKKNNFCYSNSRSSCHACDFVNYDGQRVIELDAVKVATVFVNLLY